MIKINRTQPEPPALAAEREKDNGNYRCEGVYKALFTDFLNKCYLCEHKAPTSINIEHFKPVARFPHLRLAWANLFFACSHCNATKHDNPDYDHILDCTNPGHEVESDIVYELKLFPKEKPKFLAKTDDPMVHNTVGLLTQIFTGTTENKKAQALNLSRVLLTEMMQFQQSIYVFYEDTETEEDRLLAAKDVRRRLSRKSAFAAFKRQIVRDNEVLFRDFGHALDS